MKRAVNLRLEESVIYTLSQLSSQLNTTKTDIVEKAIQLYSNKNQLKSSNLLKFAGKLNNIEAEKMIDCIREDKDSKDFTLKP